LSAKFYSIVLPSAYLPFTVYEVSFWQTNDSQHCPSRWHIWPCSTHVTQTPGYIQPDTTKTRYSNNN